MPSWDDIAKVFAIALGAILLFCLLLYLIGIVVPPTADAGSILVR